jgi:hypothetical protein
MSKSNYAERKENRVETYKNLAEKNLKEAEERWDIVHGIQSAIPLGQPIIVGHHSEKRHRRDLKKIENNAHKALEAEKKAEYYMRKAKAAEKNQAISSDNPEAITELKNKIEELTKANELMKKANKVYKKTGNLNDETIPENIKKVGNKNIEYQRGWKDAKDCKPFYHLNTTEIKRLRQRLERLEKLQETEYQEKEINGINIVIDPEDNRVRLLFQDIPSEETRKKLKHNGFKWSPRNKAWQRMITDYAIRRAEDIAKEYHV